MIDGTKMDQTEILIKDKFPGAGYILLIFDSEPSGHMSFAANLDRDTLVDILARVSKDLKEGKDWPTPTIN